MSNLCLAAASKRQVEPSGTGKALGLVTGIGVVCAGYYGYYGSNWHLDSQEDKDYAGLYPEYGKPQKAVIRDPALASPSMGRRKLREILVKERWRLWHGSYDDGYAGVERKCEEQCEEHGKPCEIMRTLQGFYGGGTIQVLRSQNDDDNGDDDGEEEPEGS